MSGQSTVKTVKPPCTAPLASNLASFRKTLLDWFRENGLGHPWRETADPWAILVSEVMLQQTTVAAVRAGRRFERFLAQFPDLETIAQAREEDLLKAWEGLGYYNRVRNLQKTARAVLTEYHGVFPTTPEKLAKLPGIGPYTAGAIASFAYDAPAPLVDGNVARVFTRLFDSEREIDTTEGNRELWQWAGELLHRGHPRLFNSALMELGQTHCRPRNPDCVACPVARFCATREPERLPRKKPRAKAVEVTEHALLVKRKGQLLLAKEEGSRRKGFYHLPLRSEDEVADLTRQQTTRYTITKHRVTLHLYEVTGEVPGGIRPQESWFPMAAVEGLPMPSPIRKALRQVGE